MTAKIKSPQKHWSNSPMPRGVNHKAFKDVYWPFIPVIVAFGLLLPASISTGSLASFLHHPNGHVLSYSSSESVDRMLADTNAQRLANGDKPLKINTALDQAAAAKASDMATRNYWSHNTPDGNPPWVFVTATGYSYTKLGENLATGFDSEADAIKGWMASPPHRENLLDPNFSEVGFGFANAPNYIATNGPATIFVAFYGTPSGSIITTASAPLGSSAPTSLNPTTQSLGAKTSGVQLAFAKNQAATWAPVALILGVLAIIAFILAKHVRAMRKVIKKGERFVWRHPIFDLALILLAVLAVSLWQAVGLVK